MEAIDFRATRKRLGTERNKRINFPFGSKLNFDNRGGVFWWSERHANVSYCEWAHVSSEGKSKSLNIYFNNNSTKRQNPSGRSRMSKARFFSSFWSWGFLLMRVEALMSVASAQYASTSYDCQFYVLVVSMVTDIAGSPRHAQTPDR